MLTQLGSRFEECKTANVVSKLEALKHVETLIPDDISCEDKLKLAELISDIIRKSVMNFSQGPENLTPLLETVLKILVVWINDEVVETKLKEGNLVVEWLSHWINPSIGEDEVTTIMKILSKLTKNPRSLFQPIAVTNLLHVCLKMVVSHNEHSERFIAAVKILIHVCSADLKCSHIARSEKSFKTAWDKIISFILGTKNKNLFCEEIENTKTEPRPPTLYTQYVQFRVPLLLVHLIYTLEPGPNFQILHWGMVQGCGYAEWCFNFCINNVDYNIASDGLNELIEFLQTIFNQAKIEFQISKLTTDDCLEDMEVPKEYTEELKRLEGMIDKLSSSVLKILLKKLTLKKFSSDYAEGLIKLVNIVCPTGLPIKGIHTVCNDAYAIVSGLRKANSEKLDENQKGQLTAQVLETYVHIATVFHQEKERGNELTGVDDWQSLFTHMMEAIKLVPPNHPEMERINIACCRLISLTKQSGLLQQIQLNHSGFKQQVITDLIDYCLAHPSVKEGIANENILSLFVELLGYLGHNSTVVGPDLFLQYSSKQNVPSMFALALSSGFESVVFKAFRVMSHVGFCKDTIQQVAARLSTNQRPLFTSSSFQNQLEISTQAVKRFQKLEERLESLVRSYEEPKMEIEGVEDPSLAISEIFSLYEVKDSIYQTERNGLLQQIADLSIYIDRLKSMMDKQSLLLSRKTSHEAVKERQIMFLSFQNEKTKKSLIAEQKKHQSLTKLMDFQDLHIKELEKAVKDSENNVAVVKRENKALKDSISKQQASFNAVEKEANQVKEENKELTDRIAQLEKEVKRKEEDRKHIEELLTQKNEQFNGIRALLQNANRML